MFSPATLRATCIGKTCSLLVSGMWNECEENPFSRMPITVVQDLLSCMWLAGPASGRPIIAHSRLLLTSGRLEHVAFPRSEKEGDYVTLLQMFSCGCRNLRTLSVLWGHGTGVERVLQKLLQSCTKLEHFYSGVCFELDALRNCRNLKTLRLHLDGDDMQIFSRSIFHSDGLLKRIGSLELFALSPRPFHPSDDDRLRAIVSILDNCPQLTSLGFLESSAVLKELRERDRKTLGTPRRFQLRSCYWDELLWRDTIGTAVLSCPLVEVLVVAVYDTDVFQHLKALKNLTSLHVRFFLGESDKNHDFYSLLDEIGHQLRHLSVQGILSGPLCLNVVCGSCPNLSTLQLECETSAGEGGQHCVSLQNLERLSVSFYDQESLFYLLTRCLRLKVLCLQYCSVLGDGAMQAILRKNPLDELEVALVDDCSLSEAGLRRFVRSASKLSRCCLESDLLDDDEVIRCVQALNPRVVCHPSSDFSELKKEQFPLNSDDSCWL